MVYNPFLHRYFLTIEGLAHYGIDAERKYISDNKNKINELIEKTSKKVYDHIRYSKVLSNKVFMLHFFIDCLKS